MAANFIESPEAIRFAGTIPSSDRAFVAPAILPLFDRLHDASKLRAPEEVFAEYEKLKAQIQNPGTNPPKVGRFDSPPYVYGRWAAMWHSLEPGHYVNDTQKSLRSIDYIASKLADAEASESEEERRRNPDFDKLTTLWGKIEGFQWVMGQGES